MIKTVSIGLLLLLPLITHGQVGLPAHGDCFNPIDLEPNREFIHVKSPVGPVNIQEFTGNHDLLHLFPAEINTVWYRFRAPATGTIAFEVTPFSARDDYDWMLFLQQGACDSIAGYGIRPLRRSEERRVGKECVSTGGSRWRP